jgi:integrase
VSARQADGQWWAISSGHAVREPSLAAGIDPSAQVCLEKIAKVAANANTFGVLADEYLTKLKREGRAETTIDKIGWLLDFARPIIGDRPVSEINAAEVLAVLRKIEARGRLESARRLRSTIGSVFRYAIATARATDDPTIALRGALTAQCRRRIVLQQFEKERIRKRIYKTRDLGRADVFDYIEVFYNRTRHHSHLGVSPEAFECAAA